MRHYTLPRLESAHLVSHGGHDSPGFVAADVWKVRNVRQPVLDMNVSPANSTCSGFDEDLIRFELRQGNILETKRHSNVVQNGCFHT